MFGFPKNVTVWSLASPNDTHPAKRYAGKRIRGRQVDIFVVHRQRSKPSCYLACKVRSASEADYQTNQQHYYYALRPVLGQDLPRDLASARRILKTLAEDADRWSWSKGDTGQFKEQLELVYNGMDFRGVRHPRKLVESLTTWLKTALRYGKGRQNIAAVKLALDRMKEVKQRIGKHGEMDERCAACVREIKGLLYAILLRTYRHDTIHIHDEWDHL